MLDRLYLILKKNNINIDKDDFYYGSSILIDYIFFGIIILLISIYLHIFHNVILFMIPYLYLRQYTGGIHLPNSILCIICSSIVSIGLPMVTGSISITKISIIIILYIGNIFILQIIGTKDHVNKQLTTKEIKFYTNKASKIEFAFFVISVFSFYLNLPLLTNSLILAVCLCTFELSFIEIKSFIMRLLK